VDVEIGAHEISIAVDRNATDGYTAWIRSGAGTEPPVAWALRLVQPDWQVLDLGANLGTFSLPVSHRCRRVVAVEAMPDNFALLTQSVARGRHAITPVHAAAWKRSGTIGMTDRSAWARASAGGDLVVPALSIDDLVNVFSDGGFDLVKIDIEGGEHDVLPLVLDIAADRDEHVVIYEANQAVSDRDVRQLHQMTSAAGYRLWYLDPRTHAALVVDPDRPQYTLNCDVVAIKGAVPAELGNSSMGDAMLVDHLVSELQHPLTIHRSYAFVVSSLLGDSLKADPKLIGARHMPEHPGAEREVAQFRSALGAA
jgi:FkbM family methyltransferase